MSSYWPSIAAMLVVGFAAGHASRAATQLLNEHAVSRAIYVCLLGMGIVATVGVLAVFAGAGPLLTNVLAVVVAAICLVEFRRMTARSRAFDRAARALLAAGPEHRARSTEALVAWLGGGREPDGSFRELGAETAECALSLLVSGDHSRALSELSKLDTSIRISAAERVRLAGVRALCHRKDGDPEGARALLRAEGAREQDFMSRSQLEDYEALQAALDGEAERALDTLGKRGSRAGDACIARWARAHALSTLGREREALHLLEAQRKRHGVAGLLPFVHVPGPASALAERLLAGGS